MTTAVGEMLKQAERLTTDERLELAAKLMEQTEQHAETAPHDGFRPDPSNDVAPKTDVNESVGEDGEVEEELDVFKLNRVPPKRTYQAKVKFHYIGRGKPLPYDLSDYFDDEGEE